MFPGEENMHIVDYSTLRKEFKLKHVNLAEYWFKTFELKEHWLYHVRIKCASNNPAFYAILFTGFKTGAYCNIYTNNSENLLEFGDIYAVEIKKDLGVLDLDKKVTQDSSTNQERVHRTFGTYTCDFCHKDYTNDSNNCRIQRSLTGSIMCVNCAIDHDKFVANNEI